MRNDIITFTSLAPVVVALSLLGGCSDNPGEAVAMPVVNATDAATARSTSQEVNSKRPEDVVATVDDEFITFSLLNTMLNSSAVVGLSIPALGTPERNQVIITLMDKAISANLLYLDAREQGVDRLPEYVEDIKRFDNAVLASLYRSEELFEDIQVSKEEVEDFYQTSIAKNTELTDDVRTAIEAKLRDEKLKAMNVQERIREGVDLKIDQAVFDPDADAGRKDEDVVVTLDDDVITWGEVKTRMRGADAHAEKAEFYLDKDTERLERLDQVIDNRIMAKKGRAAGLERHPSYIARTAEFRKTRLINLHRSRLIEGWTPTDEELRVYFNGHKDQITVPERRKVQMVVLKTKEEAEAIKQKIDAGEISIYEAARDYSTDPNAKHTLGEMGWVARGTGFKELDDATFFQEPDVLGEPVQSPAGWHLVKVLDVQDAQFQYFEESEARRKALRMYLREKQDEYVIGLRKNNFTVTVDDAELQRQFQREADFIAGLKEKAIKEGSVTQERQKDLQKWIAPPMQE